LNSGYPGWNERYRRSRRRSRESRVWCRRKRTRVNVCKKRSRRPDNGWRRTRLTLGESWKTQRFVRMDKNMDRIGKPTVINNTQQCPVKLCFRNFVF